MTNKLHLHAHAKLTCIYIKKKTPAEQTNQHAKKQKKHQYAYHTQIHMHTKKKIK